MLFDFPQIYKGSGSTDKAKEGDIVSEHLCSSHPEITYFFPSFFLPSSLPSLLFSFLPFFIPSFSSPQTNRNHHLSYVSGLPSPPFTADPTGMSNHNPCTGISPSLLQSFRPSKRKRQGCSLQLHISLCIEGQHSLASLWQLELLYHLQVLWVTGVLGTSQVIWHVSGDEAW